MSAPASIEQKQGLNEFANELRERELKECNIIISGLKWSEKEHLESRKNDDNVQVTKLFECLEVKHKVVKMRRFNDKQGKPQGLVQIKPKSKKERNDIL